MLAEFKSHIENRFPFLKDSKLLIACSGGLDSIALSFLAKKLELDFALAHCNFKLRGRESDEDEQFVVDFCNKHTVKLFLKGFDTKKEMENQSGSIQMVARKLRYDWFQELLSTEGFDYVLTAHHTNDSLETFLINLSRGTGIEGLTGIPEQNSRILRPLLPFSRKQILEFAKGQNLVWREDSSNSETKYLRNKIRHQVVPELESLHPNFLMNFSNTQAKLKGTSSILQNTKKQLQSTLFKEVNGVIRISIKGLLSLQPLEPYLYLLLQEYGFTAWKDVSNLIHAESGKEVRSSTYRLLKDREYLILSVVPTTSNSISDFFIYKNDELVNKPLNLSIERVKRIGETNENILYADMDMLNYPLMLRKWNNGDYFYPLGMKGKKKLSKYFKDEKVDIIAKEVQWLLCSSGDIVWIIGKRADERFKVTPATKQIVKITWHN
ncbi:tRNA lysidine(34) synthetase TilS [Croceitalea sp. MTPC9]|uniref:tRNA lysidine(34) synthetase TilS n=1 Tax=unclassified Croceitalea TaxID=2632280 RepID=UPI002B363E84|nr:tRNA lysidine(34) synthetase TilS [Croceitalea sp. MTPC6]GMN15597.1 tRNA lysidine(34) synthetase TilS [Croceitalea sp. MTPC9]